MFGSACFDAFASFNQQPSIINRKRNMSASSVDAVLAPKKQRIDENPAVDNAPNESTIDVFSSAMQIDYAAPYDQWFGPSFNNFMRQTTPAAPTKLVTTRPCSAPRAIGQRNPLCRSTQRIVAPNQNNSPISGAYFPHDAFGATPPEFIRHRSKRIKKIPTCYSMKKSRKIEDGWESMEDDFTNDKAVHLEMHCEH